MGSEGCEGGMEGREKGERGEQRRTPEGSEADRDKGSFREGKTGV